MDGSGSSAEDDDDMEFGSYEDFGGSLDFMKQGRQMGNISIITEGGKERKAGMNENQGNFQDFLVQSSSECTIEKSFSPLIFTHQDSTEKGIPSMFVWSYGGKEVFIEGSWDNWETKERLQRSTDDFVILKVLPLGVHYYRFIVDGERRCSTEIASEQDEKGNLYNILNLKDHVPDMLVHRKQFEPPSSPESSYDCPPDSEDYSKEPPILPELLAAAVLRYNESDVSTLSPQGPHYITLGHLYIERNEHVVALFSTERFQDKYITSVLYKPEKR